MLYKLQEGLEEEAQVKLNIELERTARKIQHPLSQMKVEPPVVSTTPQPQVRERKPPPGWLDEKTAYRNAMGLMNFARKRG